MIRFIDKRKDEIKIANSIWEEADGIHVKFSPNGKEYIYLKNNVELLDDNSSAISEIPFITYTYKRKCYNCHNDTNILTYIIYQGTEESLRFPWNKECLLKSQNIIAHLMDPSIEYYGISVIGNYEKFDNMLLKMFPDRIAVRYSKTTDSSYPMNICEHCGAKQGNYFIYSQVNDIIKNMIPINMIEYKPKSNEY